MRGLSFGLVACLGLAACVEAPAPQDATSQDIAAGRLLLVFFQTGVDEPPEDGILRNCATSQTGLCVDDGPEGRVFPLDRIGQALTYRTESYIVTLQPDGTGSYLFIETSSEEPIVWMTRDWE